MLKIYTAFTREIDNPATAANEILQQLNPEANALKNTVGIIHFYHEFVETGACQAVIDALPFETVGCVSTYVGSCETYDEVALSVTMITGDELDYSIKTVDDCTKKSRAEIAGEAQKIFAGFTETDKPKIVMPYLPAMQNFSGDDLVAAANDFSETVPLFGTIAFNMENMADSHYVLGKGKFSTDMLVFMALYGNFQPKFHTTSAFDFEEGIGNTAKIDDSDGTILKSVNGMTAVAYLKKQGMVTSDNAVEGLVWALPAILDYSNGTRIVRSFLGVVEGTEHIFATGELEKGANISFTYLDASKTLASTEKLLEEINAAKENGVIIYSCAARAWSLGSNHFAEAEKIVEHAGEYRANYNTELNYSVAYSGGEISPIINIDGKLINILHNYTLISCAFS
ncbi:MAG: FIST C-terminal domain-containing protein [Defluviitaleaceae bacterium]|nr:FIST C-terminal domain-containing protein [Defluviitaleaceae bacterium]